MTKIKWKRLHNRVDSKILKISMLYFDKNNIAYRDTVKEQISAYRIYVFFDMIFNNPCRDYSYEEIILRLKKLEKDLNIIHKSFTEVDDRNGYETYGYYNEENILEKLTYISDRWCCKFRVRWLLDLIELKRDTK